MIELSDILDGIDKQEFFLEYMPIMRLADLKCVGAEALIRWRRGDEVVMPAEFIPIVDRSPMSGPLTYYVINQIAKDLREWLYSDVEAYISFNVPPELLGRGSLDLAGEMTGLNKVAYKIIAEITERGVPDQIGVDSLTLYRQRKERARIALDDIGLTSANILVLARLPIDFIKFDRSLIKLIPQDDSDHHLQHQLTALVECPDIQVIAEGVEEEYQFKWLRDAGVPFAQGWFFAKSLGKDDFLAFHAEHS